MFDILKTMTIWLYRIYLIVFSFASNKYSICPAVIIIYTGIYIFIFATYLYFYFTVTYTCWCGMLAGLASWACLSMVEVVHDLIHGELRCY